MFSEFLTRVLTESSLKGGCGMSTRPAFYSGRGAALADLNSEKLCRIAKAVKVHVGEEAVKAFVEMVADIPVLSATDFLISLSYLERHKWVWDKGNASKAGIYAESPQEAFFTVAEVLANRGRERDETSAIRGDFLRDYGVKDPKANERRAYDKYGFHCTYNNEG